MQHILIVVDMQNDFIDGALGTAEAVAIVPKAAEKIRSFKGTVIFTRDTHGEDYMQTQEGRNLPVPHCIKGSHGWQVCPALEPLRTGITIDKPTFGSAELGRLLLELDAKEPVESITLIGFPEKNLASSLSVSFVISGIKLSIAPDSEMLRTPEISVPKTI